MKKLQIIIALLFAIAEMNAQEYKINFTGSGLSSAIESVYVLNLTQGTSLTLNGSDTLLLGPTIGINSLNTMKEGLRIYPNPMNQSGNIEFYSSRNGAVSIEIFDVSGKIVIQSSVQLSKGTQTFKISGLKTGVYTVVVTTPQDKYTNSLISVSENPGPAVLKYVSTKEGPLQPTILKNAKNIVEMQYNAGERILFKGISGNYSRVLTLIPTQSQAVDFDFIVCSDADSNHYAVVTIGTQTWMSENLKTTKFSGGALIPLVTDNTAWSNLSTSGYCWYDNDESANKDTYGALYNWYTVNSGNLCPAGWHVPGYAEWEILSTYLGGGSVAGGKLKETGVTHWSSPNTGATNETGYTALPGGTRTSTGLFKYIFSIGYWWSSTEYNATSAWYRYINNNNSSLLKNNFTKTNGYSVRCLKD